MTSESICMFNSSDSLSGESTTIARLLLALASMDENSVEVLFRTSLVVGSELEQCLLG